MRERFSTTHKIINRIKKPVSETIKNNRKRRFWPMTDSDVRAVGWTVGRPSSFYLWVTMREIVFVYEWNIGLVFLFDGYGLWQARIQYQNFLNVILISTVEQMSKSHRDLIYQHVWQTHNAYVAQSTVTFHARTIFPIIRRRSLFCSTCSKCNNVLCAEDSVRKVYNENQYKIISID